MRREQELVREFHEKAGALVADKPAVPEMAVRILRLNLIREECLELAFGMGINWLEGDAHLGQCLLPTSITEIADALGDLLYVVLGTAVSCGIDIEPIFHAIHASNMEKFGEGGRRRDDGKWLKPPGWTPPDLKSILEAQCKPE